MKYKRPDFGNPTRNRFSKVSSLGETMEKLIGTYKLKAKMNETSVMDSWEKVMGKVVSKRTERLFVKDRELIVKLTSAPLKRELASNKGKIIGMLNAELGESFITDVQFF